MWLHTVSNKALPSLVKLKKQAEIKEMRQLHDTECFIIVDPQTISATERKHVLESDWSNCANVNPQHQWMPQEQVSSPTVMTESKMITSIVEARKRIDDILNAFIQTEVERQDN